MVSRLHSSTTRGAAQLLWLVLDDVETMERHATLPKVDSRLHPNVLYSYCQPELLPVYSNEYFWPIWVNLAGINKMSLIRRNILQRLTLPKMYTLTCHCIPVTLKMGILLKVKQSPWQQDLLLTAFTEASADVCAPQTGMLGNVHFSPLTESLSSEGSI